MTEKLTNAQERALVAHVAKMLVNDPVLRDELASALVRAGLYIAPALSKILADAEQARAEVHEPAPEVDTGLMYKLKVKCTQIDTQGGTMTVNVPKGYPIEWRGAKGNKAYAHTPLGRIAIRKEFVTNGYVNKSVTKSVRLNQGHMDAGVAKGRTYVHVKPQVVESPAPPAAQAPTPDPEKAIVLPPATPAMSKRAARKAERKARFIADHRRGVGACYCTATHDCVAVREFGEPKHTFG